MKFASLPVLILLAGSHCIAQNLQSADGTLDAEGLPFFLKLVPQPAPEPWTPITPKQRFEHYTSETFSPFAALGAASGAALSQALDSPTEWGQGWGAYGIRVSNSFGRNVVGNTITLGVSAIVHDDNRFFRSRSGTFKGRLMHVMASPYVAHDNSGAKRFSTSMLLGSAGAASIPLAWSPPSWQGWDNIALTYLIWYGRTAGFNFAREFYPNLVRHFREKGKSPKGPPGTPP